MCYSSIVVFDLFLCLIGDILFWFWRSIWWVIIGWRYSRWLLRWVQYLLVIPSLTYIYYRFLYSLTDTLLFTELFTTLLYIFPWFPVCLLCLDIRHSHSYFGSDSIVFIYTFPFSRFIHVYSPHALHSRCCSSPQLTPFLLSTTFDTLHTVHYHLLYNLFSFAVFDFGYCCYWFYIHSICYIYSFNSFIVVPHIVLFGVIPHVFIFTHMVTLLIGVVTVLFIVDLLIYCWTTDYSTFTLDPICCCYFLRSTILLLICSDGTIWLLHFCVVPLFTLHSYLLLILFVHVYTPTLFIVCYLFWRSYRLLIQFHTFPLHYTLICYLVFYSFEYVSYFPTFCLLLYYLFLPCGIPFYSHSDYFVIPISCYHILLLNSFILFTDLLVHSILLDWIFYIPDTLLLLLLNWQRHWPSIDPYWVVLLIRYC